MIINRFKNNTAIGNRCTWRGIQIENKLAAMQPFYFKISLYLVI